MRPRLSKYHGAIQMGSVIGTLTAGPGSADRAPEGALVRRLFSPAFIDAFVPEYVRAAGADRVRQARLVVAFGFVVMTFGALAAIVQLIRGSPWVALAV